MIVFFLNFFQRILGWVIGNLLLKFNIDEISSGWVGNSTEGSLRQNNGSAWSRWLRLGSKSVINNPDLDGVFRSASSRIRGAYASHQVLPPTWCSIIPYTVSCCSEKIARRKLCRIIGSASCSCVHTYINIY